MGCRGRLARSAALFGFSLLVFSSVLRAALSAPSLTATAISTSQIRLNWTDLNQQETGFQVERSTSSTTGFVLVYTAAKDSTTYTNSGLASGVTYYFRVRAIANSTTSSYSNVANARTLVSSLTGIPAAPSGLSAAPYSSSQINIAWRDNSTNETAFAVERATSSAGPFTQIGTTGASGYGSSGLSASTTYWFRVRAYNSSGYSAYTNTASATTLAGGAVPAAPTSLSATVASTSQINLAWVDASSNETGFRIERSTATTPWGEIATVGVNVRTYSSTGLAGATTYYYRVRAYSTAGSSTYSNTASAATSGGSLAGSGGHIWSKSFGGPNLGGDLATPSGIAVDSTGAVIVVGYMKGNVNFGGITLSSAGLGDIYLVKFSSSGTVAWAKRFGASDDDRPKGVAVDAGNNVYITGYFRSTVSFGGASLTGSSNAFLAKYSSTGAHVWSKRLSTGGLDEGTAVTVDGAGNPIVAVGIYQTSDFGGGPLTTAGGADTVLVKYSAAGAHLWSRRLGGSADDITAGLAADPTTGEILAAGYFGGSTNLGGGVLTSAGGNDVFLVKYSSAGAHLWSRKWGSTGDDRGYGVAVGPSGYVAVTGTFTNSVDFGAGPVPNSAGSDIFLLKYSASGICQWSKGFGSTVSLSSQIGGGVAFDPSGNVLLTGSVVSTVDFGGGPTPGDGWYNAFVAKFNSAGGYAWAKRYVNGTGHSNGRVIDSDSVGNVLAAGEFEVAINVGGATFSSPGAKNTYLVKLGP
jgi:Fibronectin type III domain/Beta-propeller repeat